MKITYDAEADALSIIFADTTVTTQHLAEGIAADYDAAGCLAGLEILDVRSRLGSEVGKDGGRGRHEISRCWFVGSRGGARSVPPSAADASVLRQGLRRSRPGRDRSLTSGSAKDGTRIMLGPRLEAGANRVGPLQHRPGRPAGHRGPRWQARAGEAGHSRAPQTGETADNHARVDPVGVMQFDPNTVLASSLGWRN